MDIVQGVSFFKYGRPPIRSNNVYTILYMLQYLNKKRNN